MLASLTQLSLRTLVLSIATLGAPAEGMERLSAPEIEIPHFQPSLPLLRWHGPPADEVALLIHRLAASERMRLSARDVALLSQSVRSAGLAHDVDPRILVGVAWRESRFRARAIGDQGRSCGAFQIRTDIPGRPSCRQAMDVPRAAEWAARYLAHLRETCDAENWIAAYNAGCRRRFHPKAQRYQHSIRVMSERPDELRWSPAPGVPAHLLAPRNGDHRGPGKQGAMAFRLSPEAPWRHALESDLPALPAPLLR